MKVLETHTEREHGLDVSQQLLRVIQPHRTVVTSKRQLPGEEALTITRRGLSFVQKARHGAFRILVVHNQFLVAGVRERVDKHVNEQPNECVDFLHVAGSVGLVQR